MINMELNNYEKSNWWKWIPNTLLSCFSLNIWIIWRISLNIVTCRSPTNQSPLSLSWFFVLPKGTSQLSQSARLNQRDFAINAGLSFVDFCETGVSQNTQENFPAGNPLFSRLFWETSCFPIFAPISPLVSQNVGIFMALVFGKQDGKQLGLGLSRPIREQAGSWWGPMAVDSSTFNFDWITETCIEKLLEFCIWNIGYG